MGENQRPDECSVFEDPRARAVSRVSSLGIKDAGASRRLSEPSERFRVPSGSESVLRGADVVKTPGARSYDVSLANVID